MGLLRIRLSGRMASRLLTFWFFTKARFHEFFSYRTRILFWFLGNALGPLGLYFMAVALSTFGSEYLVKYGGNYFLFLLIGVVLNRSVIRPSMEAFTEQVQRDTGAGVIETQLTTPIHIVTYLLLNTSWNYILRLSEGAIILAFGLVLAGGLHLSFNSVIFAALLVMLLLVAGSAFGLIGAALTLVYKYSGRVVFLIITWFCMYLCGAYFPIEILPGWLQLISRTMPSTYALEGLRELLLNGGSNINLVYYDIGMLTLLCLLLLPIGLFSVNRALRRVKREGTLDVY